LTPLRLKGRIALVTGASRGIGRAIALQLGREGAHVVALARTSGGLEELDDEIQTAGGEAATLVPADIKDGAAIDRLGAALFERWGRLDVFVGNAGVLGQLSPIGHIDPKVWDDVMAVNLTANWRLLRSLDPLLRAAPAGRAVFLTSGAARHVYAYWGPYAVSKSGLEMLVKTYASETATTPVKANLLSPGPTRTRMRAQAMPGEDPNSLTPPERVAEAMMPLVSPDCADSGAIFEYREGTIRKAAA
jgi:NAD(P)-dependent dehydrogenase (short-subunit alcohol dehydrogenase family)